MKIPCPLCGAEFEPGPSPIDRNSGAIDCKFLGTAISFSLPFCVVCADRLRQIFEIEYREPNIPGRTMFEEELKSFLRTVLLHGALITEKQKPVR